MEEEKLETQTPEPEKGENLEEKITEEKTPEQMQKEINSLYASKKWEQQKRREAEEIAQKAQEEAERLKTELEIESSALSEKELKEKYPDLEYMDEADKEKAKIEMEREKRLKILEAKEKWRDDYSKLPKEVKEKLEKKGGEDVFKDFACSPENCGQKNLLNLAKQFLYEETEIPSPEKPEKKSGLEPGVGGIKTPVTLKKGYTAEEAAEIRRRDSKKYNELVANGRMKII